MKGFVLFLSLMFLLVLTLFGFSLLLVASNHYSSTRTLYEKENARIACEAASKYLLDRHNLSGENPRFFFNAANWTKNSIKPFQWQGYSIHADLNSVWSSNSPNLFLFASRKGPFVAQELLEIQQTRLEDFAFYTDSSQLIPVSPLFDGMVFARDGLQLTQPNVRFRKFVSGEVQPDSLAYFEKRTLQKFDYPRLTSLLPLDNVPVDFKQNGIIFPGNQLDLDDLQLQQQKDGWHIFYKTNLIGICKELKIWFNGDLQVRKTDNLPTFLPSGKPHVPLYIAAQGDIFIESNLSDLQDAEAEHPIVLIASKDFYLRSTAPRACRLKAFLIGFGAGGFIIESGGISLSEFQKQSFEAEIATSSFLLEEEKRTDLLNALEKDEKIVWFRGTLAISNSLKIPPDVSQLHFEDCGKDQFSFFASLPFIHLVEGSRQWQ